MRCRPASASQGCSNQRTAYLNADQVAALADTITPHYRVLIYTAAYTGLRAGSSGRYAGQT